MSTLSQPGRRQVNFPLETSLKSYFSTVTDLEDRIDCTNRSIARLRPDIRQIIRDEIRNALDEKYDDLVRELRKPKPYVEAGYRG
jgi:hypothetical protein